MLKKTRKQIESLADPQTQKAIESKFLIIIFFVLKGIFIFK